MEIARRFKVTDNDGKVLAIHTNKDILCADEDVDEWYYFDNDDDDEYRYEDKYNSVSMVDDLTTCRDCSTCLLGSQNIESASINGKKENIGSFCNFTECKVSIIKQRKVKIVQ